MVTACDRTNKLAKALLTKHSPAMVFLELFAASVLCMCTCGEKIPLHFSYITTVSGRFVAAGAIPVVDLALEQINNRTDILQSYTLNYTTILDSKVCADNSSSYREVE